MINLINYNPLNLHKNIHIQRDIIIIVNENY